MAESNKASLLLTHKFIHEKVENEAKNKFHAESFSLSAAAVNKEHREICLYSNHVSNHVNLFTFNLILIFDF